ncbi:MAG: helix-turn-helix transcriptional regulator [Saccharothrix sp.]|nr:helix-turn-helix transcriptional regulator [Saccharothrix sp.]
MSTSYTVRIRTDIFCKARALAGFPSEYETARAMGVNRSTLSRVLSGELQPGAAFIAGALVALDPMAFEDLFEVVPKSGQTTGLGA